MGKKNNQTSVSYADREIPTLWSTDNIENSVNLFLALAGYPRVGISLSALETDDKFYSSIIKVNEPVTLRLFRHRADKITDISI